MKLLKNAALSLEILLAHKVRTALSVTGIVVGVAAVILMVSAGRGAQKEITDRIEGMGTNLIVVSAGQTTVVAGRQRQIDIVRTLLVSDAEAIARECPSVSRVAAAISRKTQARWEGENVSTTVAAMDAEGFEIRNMTIATGRAFDPEEGRAAMRLAILGPTAAANLFGNVDPIGLDIRIGKVPFEVIGITAPKGMDANGLDQDDLIIVPLETAMRRLFNVTYVQTIYVQAQGGALDQAEADVRELLRHRHRLGTKRDDFTIQNQATLLAAERETTQAMTALIASVAGISLLVGGVGILAVMLMSVRERTREIGLRRAIGATRRDIRNQFLVESALLAGSGGVIGVACGVGAALLVSAFGSWQTVISWPAATVGFVFSVTVGIVFGLYPATRAARLEPIQALRAE